MGLILGRSVLAAPESPAATIITGITFDTASIVSTAPGNGLEAPGSDNWPVTWASDGHQYVSWGDGGGFGGDNDLGRVSFGIGRLEGDQNDFSAVNVIGGVSPLNGSSLPAGKCRGILGINDKVYFWHEGELGPNGGSGEDSFLQVELWVIDDLGTLDPSATPVVWNDADDPNWDTSGFYAPTFLNFGQNYAGARDSFVYAFLPENSNDGWEVQIPGGVSLMRCPSNDLETKASWEWFTGFDGNGDPLWSSNLLNRTPVWQDVVEGNMRTSVSYNAPLNVYIMATQQRSRFEGFDARVGFYQAPEPWGPWTLIRLVDPFDENLNTDTKTVFYNFSNKWLSQDGFDFVMVYSGDDPDEFGLIEGVFHTTANTELAVLADGMSADQWSLLPTTSDITDMFKSNGNNSTSIFEYGSAAVWDSVNRKMLFYGGNDSGGAYTPKSIEFTDDTNLWAQLVQPPTPLFSDTTARHAYYHNAIDISDRRWYITTQGFGVKSFFSTDLDDLPANWTQLQDIQDQGQSVQDTKALCVWPRKRSLFLLDGIAAFYRVYRFDLDAQLWDSGAWGTFGNSGNYHTCGVYSDAWIEGQEEKGCIVWGGGITSNEIWRQDADGTFTQLTDYPGSLLNQGISAKHTDMVVDPVTHNVLVMHDDDTNDEFYELDPRGSGTWTLLENSMDNIPPGSGGSHPSKTFYLIAAPVSTYGVTMWPQGHNTDSKIHIYKHAESQTLNQVAADSDTLLVCDFETENRCRQQEEFFIGPNNIIIDDTTDPDRYLRDHPNAANFIGGNGALVGVGFDMQVGSTWNYPWMFSVNQGFTATGAYAYPKVVSGVGEFEGITGAAGRSCLQMQIEQGQSSKAGGEVVFALNRLPGPGQTTAGDYTFYTAGEGAEIWIRYAIKVDDNYRNTVLTPSGGGGSTGPKYSNLHGMFTDGNLEETITRDDSSAPGELTVYSNGGNELYPGGNDFMVEQLGWTVFEYHIVVGTQAAGGSAPGDGTVEIYVNRSETPIVSTTEAQHAGSGADGPLRVDWGYVNTATDPKDQGYWRFDLTSFVTNKDDQQVHPIMTKWYDNLVVRQNTRCPPLIPG